MSKQEFVRVCVVCGKKFIKFLASFATFASLRELFFGFPSRLCEKIYELFLFPVQSVPVADAALKGADFVPGGADSFAEVGEDNALFYGDPVAGQDVWR